MDNQSTPKIAVLFILMLLVLLVTFAAGFTTAQVVQIPGISHPNSSVKFTLYDDVWGIVNKDFTGKIPDDQAREYGAIRGSLAKLGDPYTLFVEPEPHQREKEDLQGSFGGIGVTLRRTEAGEYGLVPLPDSPATKAGVQENDILVSVDGKPISPTTTLDDVVALVRGQVGSKVTVQVRRAGSPAPLSFVITREAIQTPSVSYRILEGNPQIGYIAISRFTDRSGEEVKKALQDLGQKGATKIILDMRDNGGGLLTAAIAVSSQFIPSGKVVLYEKQKDKPERMYQAEPGGIALDMPLVILTNHGTASASEITAGALRDHKRAILIGEQTYGKGSVQHIYDLKDGSSLHVTAAEWYTPDHHQLTGNGLVPDIVVGRSDDDIAAGRDPQLDRAIAYLKS